VRRLFRDCPRRWRPATSGWSAAADFGTIALDTFADLSAAARQHGNGIVEVTSRGSHPNFAD